MTATDLGPLAWVLDELRKSLDGASKALRRFVRDAELARGNDLAELDASQLRIARQQLHQAEAWNHVAGITLGQDVSDRVVQLTGKPPQFSLGKSFDTYGPIGPALVSVDAFADPDDIELWCDVAGERMQHARTSDLIFPVAELVSYLSGICTLTPGDLIFTGTPDGVGGPRGRFLKDGELVESWAEGIGTLRNRCVAGR